MINVHLKGRLGNILFQYAVGRHLAIKNNTDLSFNFEYYIRKNDLFGRRIRNILKYFNIDRALYCKVSSKHILKIAGINWPFPRYNQFKEDSDEFLPDVLKLKKGTSIKGFFQSEKYFEEIEQVIRNDFKIDNSSFGEECRVYESQILSKNSVGIHVRRGDYLKTDLRSICDINYFLTSIECMKNKLVSPHFFVFSDDLNWCKNNLNIPGCSIVEIEHSRKNPVIDLHLMSNCKHNIISNSSFSWWGAWLNENEDKIVIAPDKWRIDYIPGSKLMKDKLPAEWIKMPV